MHKDTIQVPEKGTYKWQLFNYWSDEFRQTHADHSAYIALNFAGALDATVGSLFVVHMKTVWIEAGVVHATPELLGSNFELNPSGDARQEPDPV